MSSRLDFIDLPLNKFNAFMDQMSRDIKKLSKKVKL
jgi:hypothetical protein